MATFRRSTSSITQSRPHSSSLGASMHCMRWLAAPEAACKQWQGCHTCIDASVAPMATKQGAEADMHVESERHTCMRPVVTGCVAAGPCVVGALWQQNGIWWRRKAGGLMLPGCKALVATLPGVDEVSDAPAVNQRSDLPRTPAFCGAFTAAAERASGCVVMSYKERCSERCLPEGLSMIALHAHCYRPACPLLCGGDR
jgi:hypothetical protein